MFTNRSEQLAICTLMERFPGQVEPVRLESGPDFSFELPDVGHVFLEVTSTDDKPTGYLAINKNGAVPIEQYQRKAYEAAGYVISTGWSSSDAKKLGHLTLRDVVQRKAKDKIDHGQLDGREGQRWLWISLGWGTGREIERDFEYRPAFGIDPTTGTTVTRWLSSSIPDYADLLALPEVQEFDNVWLVGPQQVTREGETRSSLILRLQPHSPDGWEAFSGTARYSYEPCPEHYYHCTDGHIAQKIPARTERLRPEFGGLGGFSRGGWFADLGFCGVGHRSGRDL